MDQPNILYLHSHDSGRYVQPYGHAVETPNIQRLAESGVLFRQAFCVNPTCSASRSALVTGSYPHCNGMTGLAHRHFALNDYGQHIVHTHRKAGYTSALAGVQHVAVDTQDRKAWEVIGYDRYLGEASTAHETAARFLKEKPAQPFFLAVGFNETHREYPEAADCPDDPRYCLPPAPLPDTPGTRQDMARFKASARLLDAKMGVVLDALEESGLAGNTLVICTTDHGIAFPRMKCNLQDSGTGVMLILRGPGGFSGGKVMDAMVSHMDLFPTVCELLGIEPPPWLQGRSLMPLITGRTGELHEALFAEVNYHAAYQPMRSVRTRRFKYIRRYDGRVAPVLPNCDDGESKTVWLDHDWPGQPQPDEALFDIIFDPNETNNLAGDAAHSEILDMMRDRLAVRMQATEDPLLSGFVDAPEGAVVNDPDGISPREKAMPAARR
jgi:N-sulfoglucosamine sulfohydrolase